MKLNKDNYELVMFDLLEGNLSEADELRVMEEIEEDEFLFREWKLFKSTVLVADKEVEYAGKASLLKKEETAILPMYTQWAAVAASVCILVAAIVFWPGAKVETPLAEVNTTEIQTPTNRVESSKKVVVADSEPKYDENAPAPVLEPTVPIKLAKYEQPKSEVNTSYIKEETPNLVLEVPKYEDAEKPVQVWVQAPVDKGVEEKVKGIEEPKNAALVVGNNTPPGRIVLTKKEKAIDFVTKNPPSRIAAKAAGILALISNPKIKINPSFKDKRPSLQIELETNGYAAVASLQPFKN